MNPINLIISGLGGQGIVSLANTFISLSDQKGIKCLSTLHKGGAQTLGSVYAEIRFSKTAVSAAIPNGLLNVLVSFDAWEALRTISNYGLPQHAVICDDPSVNQIARTETLTYKDALHQLKEVNFDHTLYPWRQVAIKQFHDPHMCNYLAGRAALPFLPSEMQCIETYSDIFFKQVPKAQQHQAKVIELYNKKDFYELA